ncbi:MAG: hypothetical protein AB1752_08035 [Candidatus Zixiibacteriota bacterium]
MSSHRQSSASMQYLGAITGLFLLLPLAILVGIVRRVFTRNP